MEKEHKRKYYSISEVAKIMGLKTHILRFWESEFPMLRPRKNRAGNRAYTERDIKIVEHIKQLLYDERYSIEGAKIRLKEDREQINEQLSFHFETVKRKSEVEEIRGELLRVIEMVKEL